MTDRDKETLLPTVYKANEEKKSLLCYRFEGLCDIILSCKALKSRDILCESSIFIDDDRKYYLLLAQGTLNEQSRPFLSVLSEFGELVNAEHSMLNLCERGKRICERNGIETFSAL